MGGFIAVVGGAVGWVGYGGTDGEYSGGRNSYSGDCVVLLDMVVVVMVGWQ